MVSLQVHDKALMLIERGDVSLEMVQGSRVQASVVSSEGVDVYRVVLFRGRWCCDCQARKDCCHKHAVQLVTSDLDGSAVPGSRGPYQSQGGGPVR
jgi:hypothetical protein